MKLVFLILLLGRMTSTSSTKHRGKESSKISQIDREGKAMQPTWHWNVFLKITNTLCGGSIITPSQILTAAHCVNGVSASQIVVYAGCNNRQTCSQVLRVSMIKIHPNYFPNTNVNDIALLRLLTPLNMNDPGVSAVTLPLARPTLSSAGKWPPPDTKVNGKDSLTL